MINLFLIIAIIFWSIASVKKLLFWVYLWQLKEYHMGRFVDHFHTYKGKRLILNAWLFLKFIILLGIYFSARFHLAEIKSNLVYLAILVFFIEAVFFLKNIRQRTFKKPVLTRKTAVILSTGLSFGALILFGLFILEFSLTKFIFLFLFLDAFSPLFFSALVLAYQPMAVLLRNRVVNEAKRKRAGFKNLLVIGVTGSYGKTSTKEYLATILSEKFRVLKTKEHQNSEVGISQCILDELVETHEIFVVEMGAYTRGGIKLLCEIAKPKIGVLTGINEQHMATFGSQENIIKAKYELIESLPKDGMAFFNGKNKYCVELYGKTNLKKKLYGQDASSIEAENLAGAKAVAKELGLSDEEIARGCAKIQPWQSGAQLKKACLPVGRGININIIDSTYSSNPNGIIAHLEDLKKWQGKKVIVMPCLIELGKASKEVHRRIGRKIGEVCDLAIITTKDRFKEIREGAGEKAVFLEKPDKIIEKIKSFCQPGDVVLLESRVPNQVINSLIK